MRSFMKKKMIPLAILIVTLDLFTKTIVQNTMALYDSIVLIPGFFSITYLTNTGAALSILDGQRSFFVALAIVALIVLVVMFNKEKENPWVISGLALMMAGTFGNLYDRIIHGFVRDMLSFNIFGYHFPVFNFADVSLVIGVGLIAIAVLIDERKGKLND